MKEANAFSPCHITGFFQIFDRSTNSLHVGSRGAGVSLSLGVETRAKLEEALKSSVEIKINGVTSGSAEVSNRVAKAMLSRFTKSRQSGSFKIVVEHHVDVPVGAGFGTSGAGALGLALALNEVLDLGMSEIEAAQLAHVAEAECKTGLGTVIAETFGGLEIRSKPGAPGIGEIEEITVPKSVTVACVSFGPLSTKRFLSDKEMRARVNEFGGKLVDRLLERPGLSDFLEFSRQFAEHLGLINKKMRHVLEATDDAGFICSMPMFGQSVFTLIEHESLEELLKIFRKHGSEGKILTSWIDFEGARILR
jgi:pantoate kinase